MLVTSAYVVAVLIGVVLIGCRVAALRPGSDAASPPGPSLLVHTVAGAIGVVLWLLFLVFAEGSPLGSDLAGIIALFFLWLAASAGVAMLTRWMPSKGRRARTVEHHSWWSGPGLALIAHLGTLVGVVYLTWLYLTSAV